ncbi:hypothetical protein Gbth_058_031 [Gluconobacter thailandicus F149-1 = NBRC 100600]|uniref:Uncharacterized protein n=2 Tax=Gluconobacter thailandicus TaxID=257438 RepID=A0AAJ0VLK3_GLUTH|nr:hypothetical protein [Gluconobacter thailandicus]KXV33605.1 hypothetical protein AD940_10820 [Gluconobacter thailandicus]KXV54051.1 hypothetical protein AD946_04955 [Gluconobacter thailandicus]QEH95167.1 hypothetical protein FXF46_01945 [Gluconobacter thailandicus]GAN94374.1 hypothetical protein Gbth_058_031 [Gluconobacter thailandicus F149-1 = NBRC 100600]GBR61743.1 hypothetical protein AA100600_3062 [Gluconobacter thailandicus F149-1 = NBRC 100600]
MERPWFAAKRYGYGAGRAITWEGRVTIMASIGIIVLSNLFMMWAKSIPVMVISAFVDLATVIGLLWICSVKTEGGWKWRWKGE